MKNILFYINLFLLVFFVNLTASAQKITKLEVGINGLTCSQCSRSVEMQLQKLPFLSDIDMDLENTKANLQISNLGKVDLYAIPKAISDAGFSIRSLDVYFDEAPFQGKKCVTINATKFGVAEYNDQRIFRAWTPLFLPRIIFRSQKVKESSCCRSSCILLIPLNEIKS